MADYSGAHTGAEVDDGVGVAKGAGTGIVVKTGTGTGARRSVTSTGGSITVTNGDGVSGNIDLAIADAGLLSIAGLTTAADRMLYTTASDTYAVTTLTSFARTVLDDADAGAARTTLGLGTIATQSAASVSITGGSIANITDLAVADGGTGASTAAAARTNLGAAATSDLSKFVGVNAQTGTSYTLVLGDAGYLVTMANAASNTLTIPTNASVAFAVGTIVTVAQKGAGATSIAGATGVTVNGVSAGTGAMGSQWGSVALMKIATDEWIVSGDIGAVA